MLMLTASCVQGGSEYDVFSFDSSFNSSFDFVISLGGGIVLMLTASCVQAGSECDVFSSDSSFDSRYLFRWRHHAHVDCELCSSRL